MFQTVFVIVIVPLPKPKECFSKSLQYDDFRGIAISPILSKVFEYCLLDRFKDYLVSADNQFGYALFLKLMKRRIPNELLNILVVWLSSCYLCVKWLNVWSDIFRADFGVRQGSVLSPFLFAVTVNVRNVHPQLQHRPSVALRTL